MPKYLIERNIPNAGEMSQEELKTAAQNSCRVLFDLGPEIQWVQSQVTKDKLYCTYIAPRAELIVQHAQAAGFPADQINEIYTTIDPSTAH